MIKTHNLTKEFTTTVAVKDLELNVDNGEIYGFLGPNGAGKTTTIMMLLGLEKPTAGSIEVFGKPLDKNYFEIKRKVGVVSENQYFYGEMTAWEYLNFFGRLYEVDEREKKIKALLERVKLYHRRNEMLLGYSHGMKQKIAIARALLHDPDLLILDEPQNGLDPYGIRDIRDIIGEENAKGRTVLISSHILSEIEQLCTRVGILSKGRLVAEGPLDIVKTKVQPDTTLIVEIENLTDAIKDKLASEPYVKKMQVEENKLILSVDREGDYRAQVARIINENSGLVVGMQTKTYSLEEAFIKITESSLESLIKEGTA
ncbi:MAG: ABC transporter ATP-binding protein [Bacillota bacterium]|nr:ABC transporter ATP-binding protein [Bacillota bacterium]NLU54579.1 ABC transporter ATP-binding protein [Bacillota bacterium]HOA91663.1 ABC transporter ATP-binding protein [Bacillota bacterium]HOJ46155.1 ABC transporter ATP-binding protein [Bacillota bacterium]HOP54281.1 ABC transporter ATP-binding protein [Bacillota bacterium]